MTQLKLIDPDDDALDRLKEQALNNEIAVITDALALLWSPQPLSTILDVLRQANLVTARGVQFSRDAVRAVFDSFKSAGKASVDARGQWILVGEFRRDCYRHALLGENFAALKAAVIASTRIETPSYFFGLSSSGQAQSILRLELYSGCTLQRMQAIVNGSTHNGLDLDHELCELLLADFDDLLAERADRSVLLSLVARTVRTSLWRLDARVLPLLSWLEPIEPATLPFDVRASLAEWYRFAGRYDRAEALFAGLANPYIDYHRTCAMLLSEGRPAVDRAIVAFDESLKRLGRDLGAKKNLVALTSSWLYPAALLARGNPDDLASARKFCIGESGKRNADLSTLMGAWACAIDMRMGDSPRKPASLAPREAWGRFAEQAGLGDLFPVLLRAWLADNSLDRRLYQGLLEKFQKCGLAALSSWAESAFELAAGKVPAATFLFEPPQARWREALTAISALGQNSNRTRTAAASRQQTRIVWQLELQQQRLESITPFEQKMGLRGWNKARPMPLRRLLRPEKLPSHDLKVAHCVRLERYQNQAVLDRAQAAMALVGHPSVVLSTDPDQAVEVVEGSAEIEVIEQGGYWRLRLIPDPWVIGTGKRGARRSAHDDDTDEGDESPHYSDTHYDQEQNALAALRFVVAGNRVRLIRFTPSQLRVAQLVRDGLAVPVQARAELQAAMASLSVHFQVHSELDLQAREVLVTGRLRAEVEPLERGVRMRLVVAPLGEAGPRIPPGEGRENFVALLAGETLKARRDLKAEQAIERDIGAALDLAGIAWNRGVDGDRSVRELPEPDAALALVELLAGALAKGQWIDGIDWPKGKPLKVQAVVSKQLRARVKSVGQWLELSGELSTSDGDVVAMQFLIEQVSTNRSRFVALGEGRYLALTERLREQIADLADLSSIQKNGSFRLAQSAGAWLVSQGKESPIEFDRRTTERLERWQAAYSQDIEIPGNLLAQLRPYQEDGVRWALRLAQADFGALLADDMGLGKTVQALAVLLARAPIGPALVVAPTSVCENWLIEAQRFAPSLNIVKLSQAEREASIAAAKPNDVIVCSYGLLVQHSEQLEAIEWATLIADEAQAVKNTNTARARSLGALNARFRLAATGTPVENRLDELWSIMQFINPGLLGSSQQFNARFAVPIERDRNPDQLRKLRRLIAPFLLRRTKAEVLADLPARTETYQPVVLESREQAHYEALRRNALQTAESVVSERGAQSQLQILAQLMRLRRAACDPRLVTPEFGAPGAKIQQILALGDELVANRHKTLIFSQFTDFLDLIRAALSTAGHSLQTLDGSTPERQRAQRVAAFQAGEGDFFLISLKAGGFGLNLTAADYVVIADPWWNPAAEDQAMGRAHRIGQTRPVTAYRLVAQGTIEERIVELHRDKRALADGLLEGGQAQALPGVQDLLELMR